MASEAIKKKLEDYRSRKEREERISHYKSKINNLFSGYLQKKDDSKEILQESSDCLLEKEEIQSTISTASDSEWEDDNKTLDWTSFNILYYTLCFILWVIVYVIFIKLGFGTVYLILSALIGMYLNTRTGSKRPTEVSAYSVFNKNCKSIDGTLKAEQFEQEIRYGVMR